MHYLTKQNLAQYIQEARQGNWDNLYQSMRKISNRISVCEIVNRQCSNEDILHDVMVRLLEKDCLAKIDIEHGNPFSYLTQVIKQMVLYRRRNQRNYEKRIKGLANAR